MSALVDTGVLLDYLRGDPRAARALDEHAHRSISVITWLEVMAVAPAARQEATRAFLRSFERLSINEAIADEALRLMQQHPALPLSSALNWATARLNQLPYLAAGIPHPAKAEAGVVTPY